MSHALSAPCEDGKRLTQPALSGR